MGVQQQCLVNQLYTFCFVFVYVCAFFNMFFTFLCQNWSTCNTFQRQYLLWHIVNQQLKTV